MNFTIDQVLTSLCSDMNKVIKRNKKIMIFLGIWVAGSLYNDAVRDRQIKQLDERVSELESKGNADGGED
jgi:hypothetical protein